VDPTRTRDLDPGGHLWPLWGLSQTTWCTHSPSVPHSSLVTWQARSAGPGFSSTMALAVHVVVSAYSLTSQGALSVPEGSLEEAV
jgi:hypothetical protein